MVEWYACQSSDTPLIFINGQSCFLTFEKKRIATVPFRSQTADLYLENINLYLSILELTTGYFKLTGTCAQSDRHLYSIWQTLASNLTNTGVCLDRHLLLTSRTLVSDKHAKDILHRHLDLLHGTHLEKKIKDRVAENIVGQNAYHVFSCLIFLSYLCRVILLFLWTD